MRELPWRPGSPRRPTPVRAAKNPLTRLDIVRTGLRIVQTEGIDAVSMRRVAAEFDTGPSSLYAHVTNKDELLQLMFDEMCALVPVPVPDGERWIEQIRELARASHQIMIDHNDLAKAAMATIPSGPNALRVTNAMMGMMVSGGIPPQMAAWGLDRIFLYLTADAYEYSIWRSHVKAIGNTKETYLGDLETQLVAHYESLSPDEFPYVHKHARDFMAGSPEKRFEFGLDLLLDGLSKYARPARS
ncbi:MAG: TetR/AcrR family transcriptional regulator [Actinoplanes sp.]